MKNRIRHRVLVRHFVAPEFIDWFNDLSGKEQLYVLVAGDMLKNAVQDMPEEPESDKLLKVYLNTYVPEKAGLFRNSELIEALMKNSPDASVKLELAFYAYHALIFSNEPGAKFKITHPEKEDQLPKTEITEEHFNEFSRFGSREPLRNTEVKTEEVQNVAYDSDSPLSSASGQAQTQPEIAYEPEHDEPESNTHKSNLKRQLTGMFD